jgi:hypothetical protein
MVISTIAVKQAGTKLAAIERQCENYLVAETIAPRISLVQRKELFSRAVEPSLQRKLKHNGAANGYVSYTADLIGYVKIVSYG